MEALDKVKRALKRSRGAGEEPLLTREIATRTRLTKNAVEYHLDNLLKLGEISKHEKQREFSKSGTFHNAWRWKGGGSVQVSDKEVQGAAYKAFCLAIEEKAADMGGKEAPRSVEEGAETPAWLALLPDDGPRGGFFRDKRPIPW